MTRIAAIDCGSNSTRLRIVDDITDEVLVNELVVTQLGLGVDTNRELTDASVERTMQALSAFAKKLHACDVEKVVAFATSAVRDASNAADFLARASSVIGWPVLCIDGDEEGRLTYAGATANIVGGDGPCLVLDIGGGSTELTFGTSGHVMHVESYQMGAVRFTERYLKTDPPVMAERIALRQAVRDQLERSQSLRLAREYHAQVIAVAGTATALAALARGLHEYTPAATHGARIKREVLRQQTERLATKPAADRVADPFLPTGRAEVIVGGAEILGVILDLLEADGYRASEDDILQGMIRSLGAIRANSLANKRV